MEEGIVVQLQKEALSDDIDLETLLRKAYLVARKLHLSDFEEWVKKEQDGYSGNVPNYRIIGAEVKAWNPYHGWIPTVMPGKVEDRLSRIPIKQPIATILDEYSNSSGNIVFAASSELTDLLNINSTSLLTKFGFHSSRSEFKKIISAVRNMILEWALMLEENGIVGDGLTFSDEEKQTAKKSQVINNYTNNFYAVTENTQIQQGGSNNTQE